MEENIQNRAGGKVKNYGEAKVGGCCSYITCIYNRAQARGVWVGFGGHAPQKIFESFLHFTYSEVGSGAFSAVRIRFILQWLTT